LESDEADALYPFASAEADRYVRFAMEARARIRFGRGTVRSLIHR
jgi:hypothetical protein